MSYLAHFWLHLSPLLQWYSGLLHPLNTFLLLSWTACRNLSISEVWWLEDFRIFLFLLLISTDSLQLDAVWPHTFPSRTTMTLQRLISFRYFLSRWAQSYQRASFTTILGHCGFFLCKVNTQNSPFHSFYEICYQLFFLIFLFENISTHRLCFPHLCVYLSLFQSSIFFEYHLLRFIYVAPKILFVFNRIPLVK